MLHSLWLISTLAFNAVHGSIGRRSWCRDNVTEAFVEPNLEEGFVRVAGAAVAGIANAGNSCFMATALQVLYNILPFRQGLLSIKAEEETEVIGILRKVFLRLALSPVEGISSIDIERLYGVFPELGLQPGQPEDVTFAIDMILAVLPPALSETLRISAIAQDEASLFISDTYVQANCRHTSIPECFENAGLTFLEGPDHLMVRIGKDVQHADGRIHRTFDPVHFPESFNLTIMDAPPVEYRLDAVAVNAGGGHYNCFVRNLWSGCWHFCDDANCRRSTDGFDLVSRWESQTHGLLFLYKNVNVDRGEGEEGVVRIERDLIRDSLLW